MPWRDELWRCLERHPGRVQQGDRFRDDGLLLQHGRNFIDTANGYQNGESEEWIGEWMETRGKRDEIVLATKFTNQFLGHLGEQMQLSNFWGNASKSLHTSFEASLKKLKTNYVDIVRSDSSRSWAIADSCSSTFTSGTSARRSPRSCSRSTIWWRRERCCISGLAILLRK